MKKPPHPNTGDRNALLSKLRAAVRGAVRADEVTRAAYATDASIYQFRPIAVIEPLDREDVLSAIRICATHQVPIRPRGGGTSLVGQPLGDGVVIDASRHCTRLIELNETERWARVQPGLVRDELNRQLKPHGLHFAPDPATTSRANIGGMIANNSSGMRSLVYGMTIDHVLSVDLALATGEAITLGPMTEAEMNEPDGTPQARLGRGLRTIIEREREEILARFPKVKRRSGGYPLDAFTGPFPWNLAKLVAGSEGTLGFILEAKINLEPLPRYSALCLPHFEKLGDALRVIERVVALGPSAVELLDAVIIRQAREHPMTRPTCAIIQGDPAAMLVVEVRGDDQEEVMTRIVSIQSVLCSVGHAYHAPIMQESSEIQAVWLMRESALGLMSTVKGDKRPIPYIEDAAVPLAVLPEYVEGVLAICARYGQPVSLFAHAGAGLLHIRPLHDLRVRKDVDQMLQIQDEVFELVVKHGGSWSGEHGDGIIRGGHNRRFFGERLYSAFKEVKTLFDPKGLMNPGKVLDPPPRDQNLRVTPGPDAPAPVVTGYRWKEEGGLFTATTRCTGVGACRQIKSGLMCPSYMATRDEVHSTRGRATVLRQALSGQLGADALSRDDVMAIFDLCISCKGCKSECPNKVDVGKMKAELQYQYYQHHRRPLRSHFFAHAGTLGVLQSGALADLANAVLKNRLVRKLLDKGLGIDERRPLPFYAKQRLSRWFAARPIPTNTGPRVALFNDIHIEYHEPHLGQAAVRILEQAGYQVLLTDPCDSQRASLSHGFLDQAKRGGLKMLRHLEALLDSDIPLLVIEPSSATALLDDLSDLVEDAALAQRVAAKTVLIDQFIIDEIRAGRGQWPPLRAEGRTLFFHPHCHQRSMDGGRSTRALLGKIEGAKIEFSNAGCCGMAGSFGYEKEHYDLSVQIAEDRLLPALRVATPDTVILTTGFSCRHQIKDLAGRNALHPIQLIDQLMPSK